jgi:hypothetical protein
MLQEATLPRTRSLRLDQSDLEIQAVQGASGVTIEVMKAGACVHRLIIDGASAPIEHNWLMEMFAREDRLDLRTMARDAGDYLIGLDVNQG